MAIKLRHFTDLQHKDGKYTVTLPGPINAELGQYVEAYREAYNDSGATSENLIAAIINQFLAGDTAFQAWKKDREKPPGAPRTPRARTRTAAVSESATVPLGPTIGETGTK